MKEPNTSKVEPSTSFSSPRLSAWLAETWERLWPLLLPLICVLAVFIGLSGLGFWPSVSDQTRRLILGLFAVGAGLAFMPLLRFRFPTAHDIDRRIEQHSGLVNQPITAQSDIPAKVEGADDPFAKAMWLEHQRRMASSLDNLKSGTPAPKIAKFDPYGLRALVGLFLFIGLAAGWGSLTSHVSDAFRSHESLALATGRIDAWVTPPAYTNRPPIFLSRTTKAVDKSEPSTITVPEGSELVIRVLDIDTPSLSVLNGDDQKTDIAATPPEENKQSTEQKSVQTFKTLLGNSATVQLSSGENTLNEWSFTILPDDNPEVAFVEAPKSSTRGMLEFSYKATDDYGVKSAKADITSNRPNAKNAKPLIKAPEINLPLPSRKAKDRPTKTTQDLTAHPWAGSQVEMVLTVTDAADQKGVSETKRFVLPERIFTKPLALAIVDERRNLALDVNAAPKVAEMLDIITTTHPDVFIKDIAVYTSLRVAYRMIHRAVNEDELREAVDLLWETALSVEDGDLSRAERRLRDAQERLSKALENGATDKEIEQLMKELRQAMNEFLQQLNEQMAQNPQNQQAMPLDPNAQLLRQQDIDRMMKQIEDLAKSGSRDAARQLLQEMQRMMNNLQTARPNQQQQQQSNEFNKQMDKLGEMMRQQQELMDKTFDMQRRQQQQQNGQQRQRNQQGQKQQQGQQKQQQGQQQQGQQGQKNQPGGQKPMTPEEFAEAMKQLQKQQGELQQQMDGLQKSLKELGMEPGKLGEAGKSMGDAESDLGKGSPGPATGDQGRALQAMREGAQQMMQNMQNQAGEQGRRGERGQHGQQSRQERDPLGRHTRSDGPQFGDDTKVPDEIDAQRAREILEAIRRKLGEQFRPKLELEYLDRLLPNR